MQFNTEVMEHMIGHVPPRVPGQSESLVCRYCCAAFSSKHQMITHITEAHSNFGHTNGDMVVCAICEQKFGKVYSVKFKSYQAYLSNLKINLIIYVQ